jgi:DNA invertase Pin-like site-specific DNA recombinase
MKFGYTRVSTGEQNSDLQIDQLLADGCDEVVSEVASGIKTNRPILEALLNKVRKEGYRAHFLEKSIVSM